VVVGDRVVAGTVGAGVTGAGVGAIGAGVGGKGAGVGMLGAYVGICVVGAAVVGVAVGTNVGGCVGNLVGALLAINEPEPLAMNSGFVVVPDDWATNGANEFME
jgi:hypothetical protein